MEWLKNAKITTRLFVSFSGILLLMVGLAAFAIQRVNLIDNSLTTVNDVNNVKQRYAINFRGSVHDRAIAIRDVTLMSNAADVTQQIGIIDKLSADYARAGEALDKMFAERQDIMPKEREILASIKETETRTLPLVKQVIALRQSGDTAGATAIVVNQARPLFVEWLNRINQFIDFQEADSRTIAGTTRAVAASFQVTMLVSCAVALAVGALLAGWAIGTVRPLRALTATTLRLAEGDLTTTVPATTSRDEVGEIIRAVQVFKDNMIRAREMEAENATTKQRAEAEKHSAMAAMADQFEKSVGSIVGKVATAAGELEQAARTLDDTLARTNQQASNVATAASHATANVEAVASACDDLAGSVRNIGQQVRQSSSITNRAVQNAEATRGTAEGLVSATQKIDEVVQLINDIAGQTNLLALNATIEAARAGEAGKGFAVVANEVKNLANQTARATEDITSQIADVQNVTRRTVESIREIVEVIGESSQIANSISAAVERQDTATQEIAGNVRQASAGTSEVSSAISEVSGAAAQGGQAATRVLTSAQELSRTAAALRNEVTAFLDKVRSA